MTSALQGEARSQSDTFNQAARAIECADYETRRDGTLTKVVGHEPAPAKPE